MSAQVYRTAALVISAALRDDDQSVKCLLHRCDPATAEAVVLAMAERVRLFVPPEAIREELNGAQHIARTEATQERNHR